MGVGKNRHREHGYDSGGRVFKFLWLHLGFCGLVHLWRVVSRSGIRKLLAAVWRWPWLGAIRLRFVVFRSSLWMELHRRPDVGLVALSLRRMAVPAGRRVGGESRGLVGSRWRGALETGDGRVGAVGGFGGNRSEASVRRERQNTAQFASG